MNLEKIIVFLLVLLIAVDIFFQAQLWHFMYEELKKPNTSVGDIYSNTLMLLRLTIYTSTFIGIYKLIKCKRIELIDAFKFPIFYSVIATIFWYLILLLSKENSYLLIPYKQSWHVYVLLILNIVYIILVCIYFLTREDKKEMNTSVPASPTARFFNYLIDIGLIMLLTIGHIRNFQHELILQNFLSQREIISLLFMVNTFLYYFVLESVFLQTIGKLHNNSFVEYNGNRFTAILTRTLCRLIPFEAFTCFGNRGWHDLISQTKVVVAKKDI